MWGCPALQHKEQEWWPEKDTGCLLQANHVSAATGGLPHLDGARLQGKVQSLGNACRPVPVLVHEHEAQVLEVVLPMQRVHSVACRTIDGWRIHASEEVR
eukprot:6085494-Amphidinium_carterae.1